jgi:hypothetical protein
MGLVELDDNGLKDAAGRVFYNTSKWTLKKLFDTAVVPKLRRDNQIKTIQASLAIEGNTLSLEQVTAVISGKRVLGMPRELQEVRNTFTAYEELPNWSPIPGKICMLPMGC